MKLFLYTCPLLLVFAQAANLRSRESRQLGVVYHTLTTADLGSVDPDTAIGNPMKGLMESPKYTWPPYSSQVPLSLEFYYIGLDELMLGNPNVVGAGDAFDWAPLEGYLSDTASRNSHAVFRVYMHFPGRSLRVPQYLNDAGLNYNGDEPDYESPILQEALEQFIDALAARYDGDSRIFAIQAGLIGKWGEWNGNLGDSTKELVASWFAGKFSTTKIQLRYPEAYGMAANFGIHDDSFAFSTLDGDANGGVEKGWFTWPRVVALGATDFWERAPMGGETRPELQDIIFEDSYPARTQNKQDFMECTNVTHATYAFTHKAFKNGGYSGSELNNALFAHARMGYNFFVEEVSASEGVSGSIDVSVRLQNVGVAPFYYPLGLGLSCDGMPTATVGGVDALMGQGSSSEFVFTGVPATAACLDSVSLSFESSYLFQERPIKFAQGNGSLSFSLPLPGPVAPSTSAPVAAPVTLAPVMAPTVAVIPWIEDFDLSDGTENDSGPTSWTAARGNGNFNVQNGEFRINNGGDEGVLMTETMDISGSASVDISLDLYSLGALESDQDYVRLYAVTDGGSEELIGEKTGIQSTPTTISGTATGSSLALVLRAYVSWSDEYYYIDNLSVTPSGSAPVAAPVNPPSPVPVASPVTAPVAVSPTEAPVVLAPPSTDQPMPAPIAAPVAPPVAADPPADGIVGLMLVDAETDGDLVLLEDDMQVSLSAIGASKLNIKAVTSGSMVKSARFQPNGRNEGMAPFTYCGDSSGNYYVCGEFQAGTTHTVAVTGYTGPFQQSGTDLPPVSVTFSIVG